LIKRRVLIILKTMEKSSTTSNFNLSLAQRECISRTLAIPRLSLLQRVSLDKMFPSARLQNQRCPGIEGSQNEVFSTMNF
jgi:hypothetical protein